MNRRHALQTLAGAAAVAAAQSTASPNLVFILVDDLRWDALGCAGHSYVKTPNIDRLAREGMMFRNAFVTTPLCSPSRASFLTGQYVRTHRVKGNGDNAALSHSMVTWPRLLHDAGYETAYVGKWHMGTDDSPRPGFDRWVSFRGQGQFDDPPLNIDGERVTRQGYMTDLLSDYSVEFLKKNRGNKPFCLYLAHKAVHGPFTPAARHAKLFTGQTIRRAASARDSLEGKPMLRRPLEQTGKKKAGGGGVGPPDEVILNQMRCLTSIDEGVGRILETLEQNKTLDRTLIVFTSDNGYFWGEHGLGDKRAAYEESIRIPMVARYPKLIRRGTTADEMALNIDIAPTMLEAAGVAVPKTVQGRSLVSLMQGKPRGWRTSFLSEYYMEQGNPRVASWEAVRTARWKYVRYFDLEGMDEMYDLQTDSMEMRNLINEPGARTELENLRKELDRYRKEVPA
jgi:N-acetylglucosamine-6-sulfatase